METDIQAFLASYPPEVRDLALKLRALVCEVIPHALEQAGQSHLNEGGDRIEGGNQ